MYRPFLFFYSPVYFRFSERKSEVARMSSFLYQFAVLVCLSRCTSQRSTILRLGCLFGDKFRAVRLLIIERQAQTKCLPLEKESSSCNCSPEVTGRVRWSGNWILFNPKYRCNNQKGQTTRNPPLPLPPNTTFVFFKTKTPISHGLFVCFWRNVYELYGLWSRSQTN